MTPPDTTTDRSRRTVLAGIGASTAAIGLGALGTNATAASPSNGEIAVYLDTGVSLDFQHDAITTVQSPRDADIILVRGTGSIDRTVILDAIDTDTAVGAVGARSHRNLLAALHDVPPGQFVARLKDGLSLPSDVDAHMGFALDPATASGFSLLYPTGHTLRAYKIDDRNPGASAVSEEIVTAYRRHDGVDTQYTDIGPGCGSFSVFEQPWTCLGTIKQELGTCPHGKVDVFTTVGYADDNDRRFYGIEQKYDITPGTERTSCQTDWKNDRLKILNEYFDVETGDGTLRNVLPNNTPGTTTDTTSLSIGVGADTEGVVSGSVEASWSTSYTKPGLTFAQDEASDQGLGGHEITFETNTVRKNVVNLKRSCLLEYPQSKDSISYSSDIRMKFQGHDLWPTSEPHKEYTKTEIISFS